MSLAKLSIMNFKASFKNYVSLIISLAFTVLIIFNFFNLMDSSIMESLGKINSQNIKIVIQCVIVVLSCFMFFFIWYATNVFLTKRKKEIGVYVFMGLTNQRIGKLYMLETMLIGLVALVMGIGFGILISQLFTMTLVTISDIEVNLSFEISLSAILWSSLIYFIVYMIFVFKGYINLVRSSVLDMVSANRQNEYVKQNKVILFLKAILGIIILILGYYYAIKEGGMETMANALLAVILVIMGVYLLFGGFIPLIYQTLASNKKFLYKKQRTLWINQIIFRMKKNYRTYAIVTVLMICAVTALATGVAMHERCQMIHDFENVYTYQIFSQQANLQNEFMQVIEEHNDVQYSSYIEMLQIEGSYASTTHQKNTFALIPYSQLKELAQDSHQTFELKQPKNDEVIDLAHQYILSLITTDELEDVQIQNQVYDTIQRTTVPYLGYLQEQVSFYCVSDEEYERLKSAGASLYVYNYKIENTKMLNASVNDIQQHQDCAGLIKIDPQNDSNQWIQMLYPVCIFMFMVFIFASGSIIFMKLYNDAFEEKERYRVLRKIGISTKTLKAGVQKELLLTYIVPFVLMCLSSYFSVHALANMMQTDLLSVNILSVGVIAIFFVVCYGLSVVIYCQNAGIYEKGF
ncbi:FtsX-like permease family protein [Massilimicrobiota sp. SW1139]|uniref:FtsX-like permease family protein n=1 Tax=Massilimicrobiota sp. SW1139 TaxID=2530043 RepID=UPI00143B0B97|nr:ABC transporter permease [Massilimicrobiota sp. SW1139]NJE44097.1 ABC transporter permease [Massilimicrobiota sp. SW1139]